VSGGSDALDWIASAGSPLRGTLDIPGDKSVSHRAVMFAALADGVSTIEGFLEGEDTRATAAIFARWACASKPRRRRGGSCTASASTACRPPMAPLDCGNAGTGMRLLAGLLAAQPSTACWSATRRCPSGRCGG
jgi:3-phosphoshikimate 1-carboxyvinyltransferase